MQTSRHSTCHCPGSIAPDFSRRGFLQRTSAGFGWLALSSLFARTASAAPGAHFAAKAKNIIFCFMDGGPSHVDTFDPKPMLKQHEGKAIGAVFNPGAFTHTSVALHDAIKGTGLPVIETHISNVFAREAFRHHSYVSPVAVGVIAGLGVQGYALAIQALAHRAAK